MFLLLCTEVLSWMTIKGHLHQGSLGEPAPPQVTLVIFDSEKTLAQQSQTQQHVVV